MSVLAANSQILSRGIYQRYQQQQLRNNGSCLFSPKNSGYFGSDWKDRKWKNKIVRSREWRVQALWPDLSRPSAIEMEPINDSDHLDQILARARQLSQPIIIDWMAAWCRKCIYLKPKLEKLAAEFDTKIKFYYVDVNKVPQALVKRGNISKMPTIQLWKDGELKEEVIGGRHQTTKHTIFPRRLLLFNLLCLPLSSTLQKAWSELKPPSSSSVVTAEKSSLVTLTANSVITAVKPVSSPSIAPFLSLSCW